MLVWTASPLKNDPSFTFFFFLSWTFPRYVVSTILQKFLTDNDSRKYPSEKKKKKVNDGSFFRRLTAEAGRAKAWHGQNPENIPIAAHLREVGNIEIEGRE